jgi:hypothetical protein
MRLYINYVLIIIIFDLVKTIFKKNIENKKIVYHSLFDLKIMNTQFILFLKTGLPIKFNSFQNNKFEPIIRKIVELNCKKIYLISIFKIEIIKCSQFGLLFVIIILPKILTYY